MKSGIRVRNVKTKLETVSSSSCFHSNSGAPKVAQWKISKVAHTLKPRFKVIKLVKPNSFCVHIA